MEKRTFMRCLGVKAYKKNCIFEVFQWNRNQDKDPFFMTFKSPYLLNKDNDKHFDVTMLVQSIGTRRQCPKNDLCIFIYVVNLIFKWLPLS